MLANEEENQFEFHSTAAKVHLFFSNSIELNLLLCERSIFLVAFLFVYFLYIFFFIYGRQIV